jgi:hypothetical protein
MTPSKKRTPNQLSSIATAREVIRRIDNLKASDDFGKFMAEFSKRADDMADQVLHSETLTLDEREKLRIRRLGILEVLGAPKADRAAQIRVLSSYGITPGDPSDLE